MTAYTGWAIDTQDEGHGLIGRFWWFASAFTDVPEHMRGHRKALFETRKQARESLPTVKRRFPKARVVKVSVTMEVTK